MWLLGGAIWTRSGSTPNPKPQCDQASATVMMPENHRRTMVLRWLPDGSPMVPRRFFDGSPTVLRFSDDSPWFSDGSPTVLRSKE